ncbi:MAG: methionine adenosyltransferase [Nitrospiraceae bacterium]|nr:methionine adenosyltransferase [Nitrospiraceae bacterium]
MKRDFIFTSESVTEGHPDKLCDQISDALIDHFLQQDPLSRIIAECAVSTSVVFIAARFASFASVDCPFVARNVISRIGYEEESFNSRTCSILTSLQEMPVRDRDRFEEDDLSDEDIDGIRAENAATVFGFACDQTPALMPMPIWLAHRLARRLTSARLQNILPALAPDCKVQVGVEYRDFRPHRVQGITVLASQRRPDEDRTKFASGIIEAVIVPVFGEETIKPDRQTSIFINPQGPFVTGGPAVHSGLTGRKTGIDTYGEYSRQSGAALSGKDPLRVDRVGVYAARYAAKNIVAAGLAGECEVQLSYSIGRSHPVSVQVETFGSGRIPDAEILAAVKTHFDFRLAAVVRQFRLRRLPRTVKGGFYRKLASYGHVGRMDIGLPWELTNKAGALRQYLPQGAQASP